MMQDPELTISIEEGLRKGNAQLIAAIDAEMRQNEDVMWSFGGENCLTHRMHERQHNLAAARRALVENDFVACSNLGLIKSGTVESPINK